MLKLIYSEPYNLALQSIEDFIFAPTQDIRVVERFLDEHDETLSFIAKNPETPPIHPETGDRSWPSSSGRYRVFYILTSDSIYLTDIIDNRQANLEVYPGNSISTFDIDE